MAVTRPIAVWAVVVVAATFAGTPEISRAEGIVLGAAGASIGTWGAAAGLEAGWGNGHLFFVLGGHGDLGSKSIIASRLGVRYLDLHQAGARLTWELTAGAGLINEDDATRTNSYVWPHVRLALGLVTGNADGLHWGIEASYAGGYSIETTAHQHLYDYSGYWDMAEVAVQIAF